jgi:hypothetical protein
MRIDKFYLPLFLIACSQLSFGQASNNTRFEIPLHDRQTDPYLVESLGENGILVYGEMFTEQGTALEVIRVDTALQEVWRGFIPTDRHMVHIFTEYRNLKAFFLFRDRFNAAGKFQIVAVDVTKGSYSSFEVTTLLPFNPTNFVTTGDAALIGGYFNYRPLVLYFSFGTQMSKILPGFFNEVGEINQIRTHSDGTVDIIVSSKNLEKKRCLWIRSYDKAGDLTKTIVLQPDDDKHLLYGRSIQTSGGDLLVSGVYGRYTEYSRGIFVARVNVFGEYQINYYNFADLQRFFNFMKARREQRVKERIERRKVKGKKMRFNYRIMVDELIPYGDQFVMLGEAFYPHYSYASRVTGAMVYSARQYGTPFTRGDLVFDGYQFTHAAVIGFDKSGKLLWDNSFEINDIRTFQMQQFVKILPQEDRIVLLYLYDNIIRTKIIKGSEILEGKTFSALEMKFIDDIVKDKDTQKSTLDYWYNGVLFASGVQQIRNTRDLGVGVARRVFFINKLDYK